MNKTNSHDRGSTATKCLEEAWAQLRLLIPRLPNAVIVLIDAATRQHRRGHFAQSTWKSRGRSNSHEIGISPVLFEHPAELLATMLHEAAHALNHENRIRDCSDRYYHRKEFRDTCLSLGLACWFTNTRYGFASTSWPETGAIPACYSSILDHLTMGMPRGAGLRQLAKARGKPLPKSGHVRLMCRCRRVIYAGRTVADQGAISCSICRTDFRRVQKRGK